MRMLTWLRTAGIAGTVLLGAGVTAKTTAAPVAPANPAAAAPTAPAPAPVPPALRGAYLAGILGCAGCHTPWGEKGRDDTKLYAGNAPREPGKAGTPNITQDKATGIGTWTDAQIDAAVRNGKRPDGSRLSPHMPSGIYHGLTDADAAALVAFLRTVKPVTHKIPKAKPDPAEAAKWPMISTATGFVDPADPAGHGGYLAGLLKCEGCHTPPDGSPAAGRRYAGGKEFKSRGEAADAAPLFASNLTPDAETGIGSWTVEQIAESIRELVRPYGTKIKGPMNFYVHNWEQLTDADAQAIGAFLKSLPPVKHKVGPPAAK